MTITYRFRFRCANPKGEPEIVVKDRASHSMDAALRAVLQDLRCEWLSVELLHGTCVEVV